MPPRGWRKNPVEVPPNCPNCKHRSSSHKQGECMECACYGWVRLSKKNEYKKPAGWYKWGQKGPVAPV